MKVTVILIVISALRTIPKSFRKGLDELEIEGGVETIQITAFLRTIRILRSVLLTRRVFVSLRLPGKTRIMRYDETSDSNERPLANACMKTGKLAKNVKIKEGRNVDSIEDFVDATVSIQELKECTKYC